MPTQMYRRPDHTSERRRYRRPVILVPQQTHPHAEDDEIRDLIVGLAADRNVVVIVPSLRRAAYWQPYARIALDKDTLTWGVDQLRQDPRFGLVVLINRYDGVDLPGDACHALVVDGLPEALSGTERVDQAQLAGSDLLVARQVQRLEQGGRATRSNDDHCVVILLGNRLAERLHGNGARECFSPATRAQLELSEQGCAAGGHGLESLQGGGTPVPQTEPRLVGRQPRHTCAAALWLAEPTSVSSLWPAGKRSNMRLLGEFHDALESMQRAIDTTHGPAEQGFLLQQYAAYQHHINPARAQQSQKSANRRNRSVLRPMGGVEYEKLSTPGPGARCCRCGQPSAPLRVGQRVAARHQRFTRRPHLGGAR